MSRCLLRLFLEAVQKNHLIANDGEDCSRDTTSGQATSYLPQAVSKVAAVRHADSPTEFDFLDVFSDDPPIFSGQIKEPNSYGPYACRGNIEARRDLFRAVYRDCAIVSKVTHNCNGKLLYAEARIRP
jgi:hypothetical protein